jgi:3-deoxy-D-manno-octulosonic acid kinase
LITQRIAGALPLSTLLASGALPAQRWHTVGAAVARLHRAGVDHADLNAHNILLDTKGVVSVIDFDRSRLRAQGAWAARNLERLKRSLAKIGHFSEDSWEWFMAGYGEA